MPTALDPLPPGFRLIAHRGASMRAPENSRAAFLAAHDTNSREVETDVQLTTDGVVVLCHDETLTRYGHGDRRVEACSWDQLRELDFGSWLSPIFEEERLLRLDDFLAEFSMLFRLHIELKGKAPGLAAATIDLAQQYGVASQTVFTSFSLDQLKRAQAHRTEARLGWLVPSIDDDVLDVARQFGLFQICPKAENLTASAINRALKVVPEVRAWGCPREQEAARQCVRQLQSTGCSGITIDEPLWIDPATLRV